MHQELLYGSCEMISMLFIIANYHLKELHCVQLICFNKFGPKALKVYDGWCCRSVIRVFVIQKGARVTKGHNNTKLKLLIPWQPRNLQHDKLHVVSLQCNSIHIQGWWWSFWCMIACSASSQVGNVLVSSSNEMANGNNVAMCDPPSWTSEKVWPINAWEKLWYKKYDLPKP